MLSKRLAITLALLFLGVPARADDTPTTVVLPAGGLVPEASTPIQMESEELQITPRRISIHYVFRNPSDQDNSTTIVFRFPDIDGMAACASTYHLPRRNELNFMGFNLISGGNPIPTQMDVRAFHEGQDVTARLAAAGLAANALAEPLNGGLVKIAPEERQRLEDEGLIEPHHFSKSLVSVGKNRGWCGQWIMRVQYSWTQPIAAHQAVELTQVYSPVVGGGTFTPASDPSSYSGSYCADSAAMNVITTARMGASASADKNDKDKGPPILFYEQAIEFTLTNANTWNGPIGSFHLTVQTNETNDLLMTCASGLQRTAPNKYELTRENFQPTSDLRLMFLQRTKPLGW
jgi:hypothetical protein